MQEKTSKAGKKASGVRMETVSPTGHEELAARVAEEAAKGKSASKRPPLKTDKAQPQAENPKHP